MATASTSEDTSNPTGGADGGGSEEEKSSEPNANFECNICLDPAKDAVISMCGHLFCWPCLHQWLETRSNNPTCPVCKAVIAKDKVIPLYGRGSNNQQDPRDKLPPRPSGQRTEPEANTGFPGFGFGGGDNGGFQFHFGIGAFPFGFFTAFTNLGAGHPPAAPGTQQAAEEQFLSRVFAAIAVLFLLWLVLV